MKRKDAVLKLQTLKNGRFALKETMAVAMIDLVNICQKKFKDSHLLAQLKRAVIVARTLFLKQFINLE